MDNLISSFSQLNIYEKNIINNIIIKNNNNNNNIDELINTFENISINTLDLEELNDSFEKINITNLEKLNITENFQKSICSFIDFFKLLRNKKQCNNSISHCMPNWIC
jgi:hypothetical protein